MTYLLARFSQGGPFMWAILFIGAWVLAIVVDRLIVVFWKARINARAVMRQIEQHVKNGDFAGAVKYCSGMESKPLIQVLRAALVKAGGSIEEAEAAVEESTLEIIPQLQQRTGYLFTLANVATLLGLLGTITGLIQSFGALDVQDPATQARQLGTGISVAMLTTAFGLIVAVPTILFHSLLQNRAQRIVEQIEHYSTRLLNLLAHPSKK